MYSKILLFLLTFASISTYAQNGFRVYGYAQQQLPGIVPKGNTEQGVPVKKKIVTDHLIYFSSPKGTRVTLVEMYIHGLPYSIKSGNLVQTPVSQKDNLGKTRTMVPKTGNEVRQLIRSDYVPGKDFSRARQKAAVNDVVVVYQYRGKYYSAILKKLTKLEPVSNE
jgi:hypothetical protein